MSKIVYLYILYKQSQEFFGEEEHQFKYKKIKPRKYFN